MYPRVVLSVESDDTELVARLSVYYHAVLEARINNRKVEIEGHMLSTEWAGLILRLLIRQGRWSWTVATLAMDPERSMAFEAIAKVPGVRRLER